MSTVSTTTSARSGLVHSAGATHFETDTYKLIVSDGSAWKEWAADGFLYPTQDITEDDLVITYDTLQNCLDTSSPKVGDMFVTTATASSVKIKFLTSPLQNDLYTISDNSGVSRAYKAHTSAGDLFWDHDSGNFGGCSWAGSTNFKNTIEAATGHENLLTAVVSGTNKEFITITHVTAGADTKAYFRPTSNTAAETIYTNWEGGNDPILLIYAAADTFKAFIQKPIEIGGS